MTYYYLNHLSSSQGYIFVNLIFKQVVWLFGNELDAFMVLWLDARVVHLVHVLVNTSDKR